MANNASRSIIAALLCLTAAACETTNQTASRVEFAPPRRSPNDAAMIASRTCEAEAGEQRERYLSSIQQLMYDAGAAGAAGAASRAPLDNFRDEVMASYRAMVNRCRAYVQCMEFNNYRESECALSNAYYRETERDFAELSTKLANIQREMSLAAAQASKKGPSVTVTNSMNQQTTQKNDQSVKGDTVDDKDSVTVCGSGDLLKKKCRDACSRDRDC